jgi:hypothetical protein
VSYITCGVPCGFCHTFLNALDYHDDARKEYAKGIKEFTCDTFEKFEKEMQMWDDKNKKVEFKVVSIPDDKLLEMLE